MFRGFRVSSALGGFFDRLGISRSNIQSHGISGLSQQIDEERCNFVGADDKTFDLNTVAQDRLPFAAPNGSRDSDPTVKFFQRRYWQMSKGHIRSAEECQIENALQ